MQTPRAGKQFFLWWDITLTSHSEQKTDFLSLILWSLWVCDCMSPTPILEEGWEKIFLCWLVYICVFCLLFQPKQGGKHVSSWQNEGKSYQTNKPTSFSIWTNRHAVILDSCLYFSDCLLHCSSFNGSEKETQYAHWVETSCFLGIDITVLLMGTLSACCSLSSWLTHAVFFVLKGLRAV